MSPTDFFVANFNTADATLLLRPLISFVLGMAVYAIFIFKFYKFLGRKDIFSLNMSKYEQAKFKAARMTLQVIFYIGKYLILFPFVAFFWFAVLTFLLAFLAKNQPIQTILMVSMAVVSAIRLTAYYNEDLSKDLAKILPFALLGVFVIDLSYFSVSGSITALQETVHEWQTISYYLAFVISLELTLRMTSPIVASLHAALRPRTYPKVTPAELA